MGQIAGKYDFLSRVNLKDLSTIPTPAAGEHILVSSNNSMNAAGQGCFDSYVVGDGTTAATSLELHKFKTEELDEQINGRIIVTESEEEVVMLDDKYINTNNQTCPNNYSAAMTGTKCKVIAVNVGDVYRIYGLGNTGAVRQWATAGSDKYYIRKSSTTNSRETPAEVVIEEGEAYLAVNLYNYAEGDKAVKIVRTITRDSGLVDDVAQIQQDIAGINDEITEINGTTTTDYTPQTLLDNKYINMNSSPLAQNYSGTMEGVYCCAVDVEEGEQYNIVGVGTTAALGLYALADADRMPTYKSGALNTRADGLLVTIPSGVARLYVNLCNYDSTTDKVEKVTITQSGGYKGYTDEKVADLGHPLKGKTIVCFGDSITENTYNGKSYTNWIAEVTGATVINVGVGGSQIRQRTTPVDTPTTSMQAYAALDICNMVRAACENDFTQAQAGAEWTRDNASDDNTPIVARLSIIDWSQVYMVTIFGGTNDWGNASDHLGTSGSTNKGDTLGAINYINNLLSTTFPTIIVNWVSPIVRWVNYASGSGTSKNWSDNLEKSGHTLKAYAKILGDEVVLSHIPFIDLYNTLGWNMANFSSFFGTNDGTHPTKGLEVIGKKLARIIASINPY